jgi:hypothetical protein
MSGGRGKSRIRVRVPREKRAWILYGAIIIAILIGNTYFAATEIFFPYRPKAGLASAITYIVNVAANQVLFIYPDYNTTHSKPAGASYPPADEFGIYYQALGVVVATAANPQLETTDTANYIDLTSGIPKHDFQGAIVAIGRPEINAAVRGYENSSQTPVLLDLSDKTNYYFKTSNGRRLAGTAMPKSAVGKEPMDVFVLEAFRDSYNRVVFIMYGYGFMGSLAAAKFYKFNVLPNPGNYTAAYYVVKWTDASSGPSSNGFPDPGDPYAILAAGQAQELPANPWLPADYIPYVYLAAIVLVILGVAVSRKWVEFVIETKS